MLALVGYIFSWVIFNAFGQKKVHTNAILHLRIVDVAALYLTGLVATGFNWSCAATCTRPVETGFTRYMRHGMLHGLRHGMRHDMLHSMHHGMYHDMLHGMHHGMYQGMPCIDDC